MNSKSRWVFLSFLFSIWVIAKWGMLLFFLIAEDIRLFNCRLSIKLNLTILSAFCVCMNANLVLYQSLQWCHNERDGVLNHRRIDCILNRWSRRRSKKEPKLCVTGLCEGNSSVTIELPTQRASKAENPFDEVTLINTYIQIDMYHRFTT